MGRPVACATTHSHTHLYDDGDDDYHHQPHHSDFCKFGMDTTLNATGQSKYRSDTVRVGINLVAEIKSEHWKTVSASDTDLKRYLP